MPDLRLPADPGSWAREPWIPWHLVRQRHGDWPPEPFTALLAAYGWILARGHPVRRLAERAIPDDPGGCRRCGSCCAHRRPAGVPAATYRGWRSRGVLVGEFLAPSGKGPARRYEGWFFRGVRLRMCPLLFVNQRDHLPFCSVHHLGPGHRPPACGRFRPDPPRCRTEPPLLVP